MSSYLLGRELKGSENIFGRRNIRGDKRTIREPNNEKFGMTTIED